MAGYNNLVPSTANNTPMTYIIRTKTRMVMRVFHNLSQDGSDSRLNIAARSMGLIAMIGGLIGVGYLIVVGVAPYLFTDGKILAEANAPIVLFWSVVIAIISLSAGYWAWNEKLWYIWGLAVVMPVFTVFTLFSIGRAIVPFSILLLITAILLTIDHRITATGTEAH